MVKSKKEQVKGEMNINQQGRFPANIILDEEAGEILDEQSGELKFKGCGEEMWDSDGKGRDLICGGEEDELCVNCSLKYKQWEKGL